MLESNNFERVRINVTFLRVGAVSCMGKKLATIATFLSFFI